MLNINTNIRNFALAFLVLAVAAFGQTALTTTTLSSAASVTAKTVSLASASGVNAQNVAESQGSIGSAVTPAQTYLYVDREAMLVTGVSGTSITVIRGSGGTPATAHASGATVYVAPGAVLIGRPPSGSCTRTLLAHVPLIESATANMWDCMGGVWGSFTAGPLKTGAVVASVAGTTNLIAPITHISGTNAITAWGLPPALPVGGCFTIIPDAAYTTTATNNIGKASTGVVNLAQIWCYDGSKAYPSY